MEFLNVSVEMLGRKESLTAQSGAVTKWRVAFKTQAEGCTYCIQSVDKMQGKEMAVGVLQRWVKPRGMGRGPLQQYFVYFLGPLCIRQLIVFMFFNTR